MQMLMLEKTIEISIPIPDGQLNGILFIPKNANGIVIFAHGSGSGRLSPRNQWMATKLHEANFGTLLFDLLTAEEDAVDARTSEYRFNIPLLAERLLFVKQWLIEKKNLTQFEFAYFGASTGAGAALIAAAKDKKNLKAIVSRGGRPDLAGKYLFDVEAPTLLIVGGDDPIVIDLNQKAFECLSCEKALQIIPGATHLFEEPGKLEEVANLTIEWLKKFLNK